MAETFIVTSLLIVAGYINLLFRVPRALLLFAPPHTPRHIVLGLKLGGGLFFLTCAITHLGETLHIIHHDAVGRDLATPSHVYNVVIQAVAVWVFGFALPAFLERIRESLTFPLPRTRRAGDEPTSAPKS